MISYDPHRRLVATKELRRVIREQGRMESWVGRQVGLSKGHFSLILAGQRRIDEGPARIIAALLGVDFYLLFETSSETKMDPEAIPA